MTPKKDYKINGGSGPEGCHEVFLPSDITTPTGVLIADPTEEQYFNLLKTWYLSQKSVLGSTNKTGNELLQDHFKMNEAHVVAALGIMVDKVYASSPYEKIGNSDDQTLTALFSWLLDGLGVTRADFASGMTTILTTRECSIATYYDEPKIAWVAAGAQVVQSVIVSMSLFINAERNKAFTDYIKSFDPEFKGASDLKQKVDNAITTSPSLLKVITGGNAQKDPKTGKYPQVQDQLFSASDSLYHDSGKEEEGYTNTLGDMRRFKDTNPEVRTKIQKVGGGRYSNGFSHSNLEKSFKVPNVFDETVSRKKIDSIADLEKRYIRGCYYTVCSLIGYTQEKSGQRINGSENPVDTGTSTWYTLNKKPPGAQGINAETIRKTLDAGFLAATAEDMNAMTGKFMGMSDKQRWEAGLVKYEADWINEVIASGYKSAASLVATERKVDFFPMVQRKVTVEYEAVEMLLSGVDLTFFVGGNGPNETKTSLADKFNAAEKKRQENLASLANKATPTNDSLAGLAAKREELASSLNQCILLAAMPTLEKLSVGIREYSPDPAIGSGYKPPDPYGGRIIPVTVTPYQNTINALTLPPVNNPALLNGVQQYLDSPSIFVKGYSTFVKISKVVKEFKDTNGKRVNDGHEVKLPLPFAFAELVESEDGTNIGKSIFMKNRVGKIREGRLYKDNIVLIKNINVDFKGGNMATAKSDVEVKMTFLLPDIRFLQQRFLDTVKIGEQTYSYMYSFMDLITYTNNNVSTGFASIFRNQYHPDYNRLLLESFVYYKKPLDESSAPSNAELMNKTLREMPLVLDLAVVDHEIKKNNKTNQAEITVNYRGYVDSVMTDPSYDALAGPTIVDNRVIREMDLQKKLAEGCTIAEIRESIRKYQIHSFGETTNTISRIVDTLAVNNRLFNLRVEQSAVRNSLNTLKTRIEKPKEILDSVNKHIKVKEWLNGYSIVNSSAQDGGKLQTKEEILNTIARISKLYNFEHFVTAPVDFKTRFEQMYIYTNDPKAMKLSTKATNELAAARKARNAFSNISEKIEYFYLGDLVDVLLDGIHKDATASKIGGSEAERVPLKLFRTDTDQMYVAEKADKSRYYFRPDPVKIVLCSFDWYLPLGNGKTKKYTTNLADVPIALNWFAEWFRLEIIEKQLTYYPIASFIKKLAMTVITRILGEVCFDVGSDKKVLFRAQTEIGLFDSEPTKAAHYRKANRPKLLREYINSLNRKRDGENAGTLKSGAYSINYQFATHRAKLPLLKKCGDGKTLNNYQRSDYCSYIIIYPANASSYEFQAKQQNFDKKDAGIPEFNYKSITTTFTDSGFQHNNSNAMISSMDFSKQDAPYRREVKFFASNQGNFAQISGVYNVKIKLAKAAYFLYPGQLIWVNAGLGDSVTNVKSMAFILGLGGYYQVISVHHNIEFYGGSSPNSTTTVEAAWVSYGINQEGKNRKYSYYKQQHINDPKKEPQTACNSIVNTAPPTNDFRIPDVKVPFTPPPTNNNNNNSNTPNNPPTNGGKKTTNSPAIKVGQEIFVKDWNAAPGEGQSAADLTLKVENVAPEPGDFDDFDLGNGKYLAVKYSYIVVAATPDGGNVTMFYDASDNIKAILSGGSMVQYNEADTFPKDAQSLGIE